MKISIPLPTGNHLEFEGTISLRPLQDDAEYGEIPTRFGLDEERFLDPERDNFKYVFMNGETIMKYQKEGAVHLIAGQYPPYYMLGEKRVIALRCETDLPDGIHKKPTRKFKRMARQRFERAGLPIPAVLK